MNNSTLRVTETGGKFWLTIGSISFGEPIDTKEEAEKFKGWLRSAMPVVIKHIEDKTMRKMSGKWEEKK